nr:MAG: hypothetical protein BECKTUN1418E_GA0071001_105711 [Candidatus Kentron sp. TUN]
MRFQGSLAPKFQFAPLSLGNSGMQDSIHFNDMLHEREIRREWVERAVPTPDRIEEHDDGTRHFY